VTNTVSNSWEEAVFADIVDDSAFGPRFPGDAYDTDGNILTLRTTDISEDGRISYESMPRAKLDESKFVNHFLKPGDLVITRSGRVGTTAVFDGFPEPVLPGAFLIRFRLREGADPRFFCYWFNSRIGQQRLLSVARGAAQQNINITNVKALKVPLPSITTQRAIASILSAYDDLIENNQRRIALLEEAARLLYREWFVHLRFPGHEHVAIKDGVPEGWEKKTVGEVSSFISRGITPNYDDEAPGIVLNQKCIRNQRIDISLARRQSKKVPKEKLVQYGDVLINSTGQGTLGRVAQLLLPVEDCTVDSHVTIARPEEGIPINIYGHCITPMGKFLSTMGRGATNQTELSRETVAELPFLQPPKALANEFESSVKGISDQIQNLMRQNSLLIKSRDLLLPRLMNGEIAV